MKMHKIIALTIGMLFAASHASHAQLSEQVQIDLLESQIITVLAAKQYTQVLEKLQTYQAAANKKDADGNTPLHRVIRNDPLEVAHIKIAKLLIANGAEVNAKDKHGYTPGGYFKEYCAQPG